MTEEEHDRLMKQLAEHRGVCATNKAVALDAMQTAARIGDLDDLFERTGVRAFAFFTCGDPDDPAVPQIVDSDNARLLPASLWEVVHRFLAQVWAVVLYAGHSVRKQTMVLVLEGLRKIKNKKHIGMDYVNYKVNIQHKLGVAHANGNVPNSQVNANAPNAHLNTHGSNAHVHGPHDPNAHTNTYVPNAHANTGVYVPHTHIPNVEATQLLFAAANNAGAALDFNVPLQDLLPDFAQDSYGMPLLPNSFQSGGTFYDDASGGGSDSYGLPPLPNLYHFSGAFYPHGMPPYDTHNGGGDYAGLNGSSYGMPRSSTSGTLEGFQEDDAALNAAVQATFGSTGATSQLMGTVLTTTTNTDEAAQKKRKRAPEDAGDADAAKKQRKAKKQDAASGGDGAPKRKLKKAAATDAEVAPKRKSKKVTDGEVAPKHKSKKTTAADGASA
ncbi:hypothetical protein B0H19DRAFT_1067183 [Mycena capillaripes]|nr:hypothetical protein B0H19DRAFT_1067183 [Mycena capillaripes]